MARGRADTIVRQALVLGVGLVAIVAGLVAHVSLLTGLGVALCVISVVMVVRALRNTAR